MQNKIQKQDIPTIFQNGRKVTDFEIVDNEAAELSEMIQNWKERYFCDLSVKLNNPQTRNPLLRNLSNKLWRQALVTTYKVFTRPHIDYGDNVYDKPHNELGTESLKFRRWFRELACFYKIQSTGLPKYLLQLIPTNDPSYTLRKPLNIPYYYCRTDIFKNSFFPNVTNEWNKLDEKIKGATSFSLFKASLLKMGRPHVNCTYRINNSVGIMLLTRLCLGLSHLNEHKFQHNSADCVNLLCCCSNEPETTLHFFMHCHNFLNIRRKWFDKIKLLDETLLQLHD